MTEILKIWLAKRIALATDSSLEAIPQIARDGRIFGDILYNYNIISFDQRSQLIATDEEDVALNNFKRYINEWLKCIGINCSPDVFQEIAKGKSTAAIKLLYQMYLKLQDKDALYFAKEQTRKSVLPSSDNRFSVTRVPDEGPPFPNIEPHILSNPLVKQNYTIQWHKDRLESLKEKCKLTREKYQKYLQEKFATPSKDQKQPCTTYSEDVTEDIPREFQTIKDQTYDELLAEEIATKEIKPIEVDTRRAKQQLKEITFRNRKKLEEKAMKVQEQKVLLLEMWEEIIAHQEREFDENISKSFIQQSQYEKQMTTKMLHTRQQKENMMEHRKALEAEVEKEKELEFVNTMLIKEASKNNQRNNYYYEKERNLELHRRLYAEKLRLKAERLYNMCLQCVKDITDVALRHSEFKEEFLVEVPRRTHQKWNNLFVKGQPIFGLLEQPEDLVQGCLDDLPESIEEIYSVEMARQNDMDEVEFESYCKFKWPFDLQRHNLYDEKKFSIIDAGANILGHIIHRLLLIKYPKPQWPPRPDLPSVNVAACINGLSDDSIIPTLQRLLNVKGIKIISLETSINFCIQAYKDESKEEYDDINKMLEDETTTALQNLDDKKKKKKVIEPKGKKKNAKAKVPELNTDSDPNVSQPITVAIQTPRIFPGDELKLSKAAQLGKRLVELGSLGEPLPNSLVAAAFVQFLQTLKEIKGWALVNFPFNIEQAASLEEALTSRPFPPFIPEKENCLDDIINEKKRKKYSQDDVEQLRISKILPNPEALTAEELMYSTCLTAFINLKQPTDEPSDDLIELPPLTEILEPSADPLERFYTEQGCNYTFYYKTFDIPTIKHLAKLIVGEFTIPPKTSLELFGDTVLYIDQDLDEKPTARSDKSKSSKKTAEKKSKIKKTVKGKEESVPKLGPDGDKPAAAKGKGKDKQRKGDKKAAVVTIIHVDKETQIPEVDEEIIEIFVEEEPPPLPGEKGWIYADLPLSEQFEVILATSWENLENVYVTDLKQLFFVRRTLLDAIVPYLNYVKRHMTEFITRPDNKLQYMREFQRIYNEFDADMRDDDEVKAELHCRVAEFREKMWTICDVRREECENERKRIIGENWVTTQISHVANNAVLMLQIELDRFVETMQLLSDYYLATITKKPLDIYFNKTILNLITCNSTDSTEQAKTKLTNPIEHMLTRCETKITGTPFHDALQTAYNEALLFMQDIFSACMEALKKGGSIFAPTKEKKPAKGKKLEEPDPVIKEKAEIVLAEWKTALDGESERLKLRLSLIRAVSEKDLEDVFTCSQEAFHGIFKELQKRYEDEIESVCSACKLISSAIEAEMPLQPQLILEGDRFYVQPEVILFPDELPPAEPMVTELDYEGIFKISQLERIIDILSDLAPNGLMIGQMFIYLFQDIITLEAEDEKDSMVPDLYKQLTPKQVKFLLKELFGNTELIDWKDFIIYHLFVQFPTEQELLQARSEFLHYDPDGTELIKDYQFFNVKLWFEKATTPEEEKRHLLIKDLLVKMYRTSEDTINYTALLLAFCKDENVVLGVAKALELSLGRYVCWDVSIGNACVEALQLQRELDDQAVERHEKERQENMEAAVSIIDKLIDHTVHVCDSVVIEDIISEKTKSSESVEVVDDKWVNQDLHIYSSASILDEEQCLEVGTDVAPTPGRIYFLPFDTLITVITAALPWHLQTQNLLDQSLREHLEIIYESCKSDMFNGAVLVHEFLNNEHFLRVIMMTFKFLAKEPVKIVKQLVSE